MLSMKMFAVALIVFAFFAGSAAAEAAAPASPLSPAEAQTLFQLPPELQITLVAAEPEVIDPIAIRFDEDGRIWVAEMRDYPTGPPPGGNQHSRIRILEDRNGDGRFETSTTFADKLEFVTGLQPWRGGAFVTLAGAVVYMKDTTGDGRADVDEVWFEGFAEQNTQLRANHPRLGLDNHIYVANGLRGGTVVSRRTPTANPISISGMDFRFDPLTGVAEAVSGNGQFGLAYDDWGNRFLCTNRNPCKHVVIEDRYLKRNPGVAIPAVVSDVAKFAEQSRVFPLSRAWTTSNLHAGQFTAACGVFIYRGNLLPDEYRGNAFTCDPTGNLVHREIVRPSGASFTSRPAYEDKEFLASPDEWFRPVSMELGPDGALYVVDMYRCVIEHPDFVPDELKRRPDLRLGDDRGRIWRIAPAKETERRPMPKLSELKSEQLVLLLEHPNAWQRETAQRLLLEREWKPVVEGVRKIATESRSATGRSHALWLLSGMKELTAADILRALDDADPQVRRQALLLAEVQQLPPTKELQALIVKCIETNDSPQLHFQAMLLWSQVGGNTLFDLHSAKLDDIWLRRGIQLAASRSSGDLLSHFVQTFPPNAKVGSGKIELARELALHAGASERDNVAQGILQAITFAKPLVGEGFLPLRFAMLDGLSRGLARRKSSLAEIAKSESLAKSLSDLAASITAIAMDTERPSQERIEVVGLMAPLPDASAELAKLAQSEPQQTVRQKAIATLAESGADFDWKALLATFASETPAIRRAILDGVLRNSGRTGLLLDELEAGRIKPAELDPAQTNRLLQHRDAALKQRAAMIFGSATPEDRVKALAAYQHVLQLKGDAVRGRTIFEKNCATCHKVGDVGVNVAPEISDSRTKTAAQLLTDILQPNRAIDSNYVAYSLLTTDGNALTGILAVETATSITLRQPGDKTLTISRSEIEQLKSSGVSLMPEGLEKNIPPADMADLLAFLKNWRYLDGKTPLGK